MPLQGRLTVPGDKSISHRALIFSSLCPGTSRIQGLLHSADVLATQTTLEAMGVQVSAATETETLVTGTGILQEPGDILDAQNSGTTMRLLSGLLAAQSFYSVMTGDAALRKRPMDRVIQPLRQMGAQIVGRSESRYAPLTILPATTALSGIRYPMPVASAQVKSAILLAGLYAESPVEIIETSPSRDHTERMLQFLGIPVASTQVQGQVTITLPTQQIQNIRTPREWVVPGDISSAAFFLVAGLLIPGSCLRIENVGLNPHRMGLIDVLQSVGGKIHLENLREACGEPVGDLVVESSALRGDITLTEQQLPSLIDEVPILSVAGLFLEGTLTVTGAEELRKKESDRIQAMADAFETLGFPMEVYPDGFRLQGNPSLLQDRTLPPAKKLFARHDHRIAMALSILNLIRCGGLTWEIEGREWVKISYPGFFEQLNSLNVR